MSQPVGEKQLESEGHRGNAAGQPSISKGADRAGDFEMMCGPLIRYTRMSDAPHDARLWHGSVLAVMQPGSGTPELRLRCIGSGIGGESHGTSGDTNGISSGPYVSVNSVSTISAKKLLEDKQMAFWRFDLDIPLQENEAQWEYELPGAYYKSDSQGDLISRHFYVPSKHESMRIMFHSCNGFSVDTDVDAWAGLALWNEVLRIHKLKPLHVMIGGGDQIYNDGIRVEGPLRHWAEEENPRQRRIHPFDEQLRQDCDDYFFRNYCRWYTTEPFATANGQIPQVNIWDDHDIIDGFGSYTDHMMRTPVFVGIGHIAFKYYMLFQHHTPPPVAVDILSAPRSSNHGSGIDSMKEGYNGAYLMPETEVDPSWILGNSPGPYLTQKSRSIYAQLGKRVAFLGVDARTERTRHQINYPETYDLIFNRLNIEFNRNPGEIKHLIILLGVPIAYPRLVWLENILRSPIIGPIRFLHRRFGVANGLFNKFDGAVDLLDDLDDHYTARTHKRERNEFIHRLQNLAQRHSVRITILGGDVHLAAAGRFYSNPLLNIPTVQDHRYMANVISSAITNKPPPQAVANMVARRNRIHHLGKTTDETLLDLFNKNPGDSTKTAKYNHCTMPSRNFAIISESVPPNTPPHLPNGTSSNPPKTPPTDNSSKKKIDGHGPLHAGEENAGTTHPAVSGVDNSGLFAELGEGGGLDIVYRVEIDARRDRDGRTEGYAFTGELLSPTFRQEWKTLMQSSTTVTVSAGQDGDCDGRSIEYSGKFFFIYIPHVISS
jgi:PhoD related phosphatase